LSAIASAAENPDNKSLPRVNHTFATGVHASQKIGGNRMSVLRETAAAVAGVCALIVVCDACFGVGETRFDDEFYRASFYAPRPQSSEFRFAADITPAARVSDAFAQFTPGEAKSAKPPAKRYSSLPTILR
jgi:hypothetical protein